MRRGGSSEIPASSASRRRSCVRGGTVSVAFDTWALRAFSTAKWAKKRLWRILGFSSKTAAASMSSCDPSNQYSICRRISIGAGSETSRGPILNFFHSTWRRSLRQVGRPDRDPAAEGPPGCNPGLRELSGRGASWAVCSHAEHGNKEISARLRRSRFFQRLEHLILGDQVRQQNHLFLGRLGGPDSQ